ncbi:TPA: restriction endonuclease subunit S [Bacillus toyonensis]|nr:restriction endonuclease subunit S [Bacillus toyonensis]HDR7404426.1 restriction endonuclease subunit S [Bacillus toyonensis]
MAEVRKGYKRTDIGEIPIEWDVKRIMDIAEVFRGASPRPKGDPRYYGGNVPRLMVADVTRDYKYVTPKIDFLTEDGAKLSRPMPTGSLVVVCSGTVGVPAILAVDACIHDGFLGLKNISNDCDKEFLFYCFSFLRTKFDSAATHGGVFTNLTTSIMNEFTIALPPIGEQKEIVAILSSVDIAIQKTTAIIDQTKKVKKGLMQQLFTKGIGHTKFKKTEIGELPSEWKVVNLEEVTVFVSRGKGPSYVELSNFRVINQKCIRWNGIELEHVKFVDEDTKGKWKEQLFVGYSDILMNSTGTGTIGRASIIKQQLDNTVVDSHVTIIRSNPEVIVPHYLKFYFELDKNQQRLAMQCFTGSTNQVELSRVNLLKFPILLPTLDEQKQIVNTLTSIEEKITNETKKMETLQYIKKGLMQSLLTGKVRVKVDEVEVTQV